MELNDTWFGLEGANDGHPFLIRGRENVQAFRQSGFYTERIDIVWWSLQTFESINVDRKVIAGRR